MRNEHNTMNSPGLLSVITTIQAPTGAVRGLCRSLRSIPADLLVMGDKKGPHTYPQAGAELFTLDHQMNLPLRLPQLLPVNHYCRKNIGYLIAISRGAGCIYETDDDNAPNADWQLRTRTVKARKVTRPQWCNVYRYFSDDLIWPRGLPLDQISAGFKKSPTASRESSVVSPIQQGLVDGSPDVDAIWRLALDRPYHFQPGSSIALMPGVWCPFNSQSTWWWPDAYPLMYLPSFCSFRMTDIWRSFVAQRCLWALGGAVTFHASEVIQKRNAHNLMKDFQDEVPGYLSNDRIVRSLEDLPLEAGRDAVGGNLLMCYDELIRQGIMPRKERPLIKAWLGDLRLVASGQNNL
jgi:hypothetical protein